MLVDPQEQGKCQLLCMHTHFEQVTFIEAPADASHRPVSVHLLSFRMQFPRIDSFTLGKYAFERAAVHDDANAFDSW